ncbi:uncharacterized protein G2W53_021376 [Senna tora]|uniref:Uncharacterized protein n=1 Tax=Senna tora TaxID=362788 RepID=A0A834TKZ0_9FABA|nr:uncharacterized protein G2W53_021376 [Senna tora]
MGVITRKLVQKLSSPITAHSMRGLLNGGNRGKQKERGREGLLHGSKS